ncbi:carbohydrate porin [Sphingomonas endophytica]|uniref:carbohydrate porin n=1 Tax=Sphingomonas endophytica TaxID=869719 RepID=UPI000737793B|nr:carbohydrate porin [Sphingomonas endophytica]
MTRWQAGRWWAVTFALVPGIAAAQNQRPTGYPRAANERSGGPVTTSAVYTADTIANVAGGRARGVRYLDNLDLQVAVDAEALLGWRGARAFGYVIYNNGTRFSPVLSGDFQVASNIETGVPATRLFEAWVEQDIGRAGSVKAGLYNLNAEFDTTIAGSLFLLSSHGIGPDIAQSGRRGPSIFPVTSLAVRGEVALDDRWLVRAAVLDAVPGDPTRPAATAIRLGRRDGALIIAELARLGPRTKLAVGSWRYIARLPRLTGAAREEDGNRGAYALVERQLTGADRGGQGVGGWLRYGFADRRYNAAAHYVGGGVVRTGTLPGRPADQIGLSAAMVAFGPHYRRVERVGPHETVVELTYRLVARRWLNVQPDLQWIVHPGGRRDVGNAWVAALRVKIGR